MFYTVFIFITHRRHLITFQSLNAHIKIKQDQLVSVYGTCEVHTFSLNAVSLYICREGESLKWKQAIIKGENFTILLLLYTILLDDHGHGA